MEFYKDSAVCDQGQSSLPLGLGVIIYTRGGGGQIKRPSGVLQGLMVYGSGI